MQREYLLYCIVQEIVRGMSAHALMGFCWNTSNDWLVRSMDVGPKDAIVQDDISEENPTSQRETVYLER